MNKKTKLEERLPINIAKLLVVGVHSNNELAFELGKQKIYMESMIPIEANENVAMQPNIVSIRYTDTEDLNKFINNPLYKTKRIFKSAIYKKTVREKVLLWSSAKNLLHIINGSTLRIISKDKKLRQQFYEIAKTVNKEEKLNVNFDFDEYDATIEIQKYVTPDKVFMVLTISDIDELISET